MRTAIYGVVALGIASLLEAEKHRPNERHQRAFAGFVRPVKYVESRIQRSPFLIGPNSESINVDVLNSHRARTRGANRCQAQLRVGSTHIIWHHRLAAFLCGGIVASEFLLNARGFHGPRVRVRLAS